MIIFLYHLPRLFPVPLINILVNPAAVAWLLLGLTIEFDDSPILATGLFTLILLQFSVARADIPAVGDDVEDAIPVAINVLWGE